MARSLRRSRFGSKGWFFGGRRARVLLQMLGLILALMGGTATARAELFEYPPLTRWYENPLGFSPLEMHTSNALLVSGLVAGGLLLMTDREPSWQRKWSFVAGWGVSWGYYPPFTRLMAEEFGVLYWPRSWMAFSGEVTIYHPFDDFNRTSGIGLRPSARFYPIRGERLRAFFMAGAGLIVFAKEFPLPTSGYGIFDEPRRGTHVNGTPVYGVALEYSVLPRLDVCWGLRHVHVSNGNTAGQARNPGHDSNGFYAGVVLHDRAK